jgi:AbrB family looped-hinge helix DNA binding protein
VSRITSKLQVTIPKAIAQQYGLQPGDEIAFVPAGDVIRVVPGGHSAAEPADVTANRLRLFDAATARLAKRAKGRKPARVPRQRGWTREELYDRAGSR